MNGGVLAHEMAQADLGHVAKTVGTRLNVGMIILDQIIPGQGLIAPVIADLGVMKPFSRSEEYEADAHGAEILNRAGYDGKPVTAHTLSWLLQVEGPSGGFLRPTRILGTGFNALRPCSPNERLSGSKTSAIPLFPK